MADSVFKADVLKGRVALVTGGGSGIGFGIAERLGEHGAKVVLMGRRKDVLDGAVAALRKRGIAAEGCAGDVRSEEDAKAAVALAVVKFGKLDTVVCSAAGNFLSLAEDLSTKGYSTIMQIDAIGTFNTVRQAFPELKKSGDGCVINISAMLHTPATWYVAAASSAKAAIDSLTRSLALEW